MSEPVVTVKQGQIKGHIRQTFDGENFYEFLGIPYAKPPIGSLRFKAPQPPECWTGVRDGTKEGNFAYCLDYFSGKICGSEDCLFLNVFIKQLPQSGCTLKPVMVYIHGGGFIGGSSALSLTGPKLILNEDVVLVTLNYRLGALGFLCIDDTSLDVPGNAGLKDQTMALRWVKENISYFNGDPNNVTIFGVSAGGAAVQFQILSPSAKGLFHKAIMQSGSALNPWAWGQKNSVELANLLKPGIKTEKEALEILVNAPVADLYSASIKITDNLLDSSKRRPFGPVVEKPNPTAFLTDNPIDILTSGSFSQVPLIQDSSTGAHHGAELTLLFDTQIIQLTDECIQASKKFVKMWSNFAKNGIPSTDDIKWDPVTNPEELVYLDISENSQMKKNPFSRNVQFWNEVLRTTPYDKASFNS
ncbi:cocaine esterase-like isoform X2 [Sitophilus oryzae]|uniref:Cocaine esterase-like isoform X2 n=1 Tax=Sitophilus oryzae TaxID=7048 RepID=A0A6J2YNX3_SITOR|nr:cocaine esterase-like isoform X2 [Sitophilus oryzae]